MADHPAGGTRTRLPRDPVATRRALLDAGAVVLARDGAKASLDAVAREAGVSKGGLLHHFAGKDALLVGLVEDWFARFGDEVERLLDPADSRPGRLTRAYISASFDPGSPQPGGWTSPPLLAALLASPAVLAAAAASERRWQDRLNADGLDPQRIQVIVSAVDGVLLDELFGGPRAGQDRRRLRDLLLALTEQPGPLVEGLTDQGG